ncbi:MAG: alkaline phosphatase, partial [Gemmatimonadetes bacterium]
MTRRSTLTATLIVALACGEDRPPLAPVAELSGPSDPMLLAAGNIASCGTDRDELTARLLDTLSGTVLTLGDNAYPNGTLGDYQNCYDPTWGRHKARTYATLGNRDYNPGAADGAFDYFGNHAGPRGKGYYSFDLGAWHILVLNSNGAYVPYGAGSEQDAWLQADLAANTQKCLLAAWHHPRFFSSRDSGWTSAGPLKTLWSRLYAAGADLVLNAQQHLYERFTPMTP